MSKFTRRLGWQVAERGAAQIGRGPELAVRSAATVSAVSARARRRVAIAVVVVVVAVAGFGVVVAITWRIADQESKPDPYGRPPDGTPRPVP